MWANLYSVAQIKLVYLLFLPPHLQHAYPRTNEDETAIAATPPSKIKWRLPASVVAATIDAPKVRVGADIDWVPGAAIVATYNPCTLRAEGATATLHKEFTRLGIMACGMQEARPRESDTSISWKNGGSAAEHSLSKDGTVANYGSIY